MDAANAVPHASVQPGEELSERDRAILAFERHW